MSDTAKPAAQVFAEGMSARSLGKPVAACPYASGSEAHEAWVDGWHESDALDEDPVA
jgi:ribosome modulation factor